MNDANKPQAPKSQEAATKPVTIMLRHPDGSLFIGDILTEEEIARRRKALEDYEF